MALGVARRLVPPVDRDQDLLAYQGRCLSGAQADAREEARDGRREDGLLGEGGGVGRGEGGAVDVAYVSVVKWSNEAEDWDKEVSYARQLRLMMPTMRPVGCLSELRCSVSRSFDSLASTSSPSSPSSSESSTSSFLSVAGTKH